MTLSMIPDGGSRAPLAAAGFDPASAARLLDEQAAAVVRVAAAAREAADSVRWRGEAGDAFSFVADTVAGLIDRLGRELDWLAEDARRVATHAIVEGGIV